jgi:hypothetical protein
VRFCGTLAVFTIAKEANFHKIGNHRPPGIHANTTHNGKRISHMTNYMQPTEDNGEVLSKIILLVLGIFIGATVMGAWCWLVPPRAHTAHADTAGPGAAHAMENLPNSGPVAVPAPEQQDPAYAAQAMQQPMPGAMPAPQIIQTGVPLMLPAQMQQTQTFIPAQPTTLYAGQMMDDQDHQIGRNGLRGNPCVDPPSCRGRAYSSSLQ